MFAATKTDVADDSIEVEDDSTAAGSSKESGNKKDHEKETTAQNQPSNRVRGNKWLTCNLCMHQRKNRIEWWVQKESRSFSVKKEWGRKEA